MALEESQEKDRTEIINGIKVACDEVIYPQVQDSEIHYETSFWGSGFVLRGAQTSSC